MTTIPKAFTNAFTHNQTDTIRVAIYLRVSSDNQVQNGGSLSDQEQRLKAKAEENGWQIYDYYREAGKTGHTGKRPQLTRMMDDARQHKFNVIMFPLVNRFFREIRQGHNFMYELKEQLGIEVLSLNGKFDTRHPDWKHELNRQLDSAEEEWETISERTTTFRDRQDKKHEWSSGRVIYGLKFDKTKGTNDSNHLKKDDAEAEGRVKVFEIFTTGDRKDDEETAELMNKTACILPKVKKVKQPDGSIEWERAKKWTSHLVDKILTEPVSLGGSPDHYPDGWIYNSPRLIPQEVWDEAQRRRALNKHFPPERAAEQKAQFEGGTCKCGLCGRTISLSYSGNKPDRYACRGRGVNGCTLPRFKRQNFEAAVNDKLSEQCGSLESFIAQLEENKIRHETERQALFMKRRPVMDEIAAIQEEQNILTSLLKWKRVSPADYDSQMAGLQAKIDKLVADSGNDIEHAKTLMMEYLFADKQVWGYDLSISILKKCVSEYGWKTMQTMFASAKPSNIDMRMPLAQIALDYKAYAKPDTYKFVIKPNPSNPEYPYVVEANADIQTQVFETKRGMQRGSASTCSRL